MRSIGSYKDAKKIIQKGRFHRETGTLAEKRGALIRKAA
jgi:hypothetical protein